MNKSSNSILLIMLNIAQILSLLSIICLIIFIIMNLHINSIGYVVVPLVLFGILELGSFVIFSEYTNECYNYPITHNVKTIIRTCAYNNCIDIEFCGNGKWCIYTQDKTNVYEFDMGTYAFPRRFIVAWFVRNLNYAEYNKKHECLTKIADSHKVKYERLYLRFINKKKSKVFCIVKNNRTKAFPITSMFIMTKFYRNLFPYCMRTDAYRLDEEIYHDYGRTD